MSVKKCLNKSILINSHGNCFSYILILKGSCVIVEFAEELAACLYIVDVVISIVFENRVTCIWKTICCIKFSILKCICKSCTIYNTLNYNFINLNIPAPVISILYEVDFCIRYACSDVWACTCNNHILFRNAHINNTSVRIT